MEYCVCVDSDRGQVETFFIHISYISQLLILLVLFVVCGVRLVEHIFFLFCVEEHHSSVSSICDLRFDRKIVKSITIYRNFRNEDQLMR